MPRRIRAGSATSRLGRVGLVEKTDELVDLVGLRVRRRVLVEPALDHLHRVSREPRSRLGRVQRLLEPQVGIDLTKRLCEKAGHEVIAGPWTERVHAPAGSHEYFKRASGEGWPG